MGVTYEEHIANMTPEEREQEFEKVKVELAAWDRTQARVILASQVVILVMAAVGSLIGIGLLTGLLD